MKAVHIVRLQYGIPVAGEIAVTLVFLENDEHVRAAGSVGRMQELPSQLTVHNGEPLVELELEGEEEVSGAERSAIVPGHALPKTIDNAHLTVR